MTQGTFSTFILPFFLLINHLSLAYSTVSSMDSNNRKYPIHSDINTSTLSTGSLTVSTSPLINVILSSTPFSLAISTALYMIVDWSIANTRLAPALTVKRERIPVPQPISRTTYRNRMRERRGEREKNNTV